MEIGARRAGAPTCVRRQLDAADAFLHGAVVIRASREPCIDRGSLEMWKEIFRSKRDGHVAHGPLRAVIRPVAAPARFELFEVGEDLAIAPAREALPAPDLIVLAAAANVDHRVDGGAAAERLAAPDGELAMIEARLRLGFERPYECAVVREPREQIGRAHV